MATAAQMVDAPAPVGRHVRDVSEPASLEFLVRWDNGGGYHREIVGASGESLVQPDRFGSERDPEFAVLWAYEHASLARLEPHIAVGRERGAA